MTITGRDNIFRKDQIDLVSIIIPAFNAECFLETAYNNIKKQLYSNLEVIIVNDGSTDSTESKLAQIAERDSRFIIINIQNGGPGYARNQGLKVASGKFCAFIDVDDVLEENYISRMMQKIGDADICICKYIKNDGIKTIIPDFPEEDTCIKGDEAEAYIFRGSTHTMMISPCCKLFRTQYLTEHPFTINRKCEDEEWAYKTIYQAEKVVLIPDILYEYRVIPGSDSHSPSFKRLYDTALNYFERMVFFTGKEEKYYNDSAIAYYDVISTLLNMYKIETPEYVAIRELYKKKPFNAKCFFSYNRWLAIKIQLKLFKANLMYKIVPKVRNGDYNEWNGY